MFQRPKVAKTPLFTLLRNFHVFFWHCKTSSRLTSFGPPKRPLRNIQTPPNYGTDGLPKLLPASAWTDKRLASFGPPKRPLCHIQTPCHCLALLSQPTRPPSRDGRASKAAPCHCLRASRCFLNPQETSARLASFGPPKLFLGHIQAPPSYGAGFQGCLLLPLPLVSA